MANLRRRLANRLVELRGDRSQLQFSRDLGLSRSTLNRLEEGTQNVTLDILDGLCDRLNCDVAELFSAASERTARRARTRRPK